MPIIYIPETPSYSFYERQLPNGVYRYEGRFIGIHYCIDSVVRKTQEELNKFLDNCSIDFLLHMEGYIITLNPDREGRNNDYQPLEDKESDNT